MPTQLKYYEVLWRIMQQNQNNFEYRGLQVLAKIVGKERVSIV